jgi:hypothetical protein
LQPQQQQEQDRPALHAKRSQNHMFWDAAPKAIDPSKVG